MRLHVDLETLELIEGPGFRNPVTSLRFKRGDGARLEVVFLAGGTTPATIGDPEQLELRFGVKPRNRYDIGYLVHTADWTMPDPEPASPVYQCSPSFNTVELDSALGVGSATGTELAEIALMGEITWRAGAAEPTSTRTFLVVVENDVNRGTEGVPVEASPPYPAPENIEFVTRKGAANGYAGLGSNGKVPWTQLDVGKDSINSTGGSAGQVLTAISNNQTGWETPETRGAAKHAGEIVHVSTVDLVGGTGGDVGIADLGTPPPGMYNLVVLCTSHVSSSPTANELCILNGYPDAIVCDDGLSPQTTASELVLTLPDPATEAFPKACVARYFSAQVEMFLSGRLNALGDTASLTVVWVKGGSDALAVDAARQVFGTLPVANLGIVRKTATADESRTNTATIAAHTQGLGGWTIEAGGVYKVSGRIKATCAAAGGFRCEVWHPACANEYAAGGSGCGLYVTGGSDATGQAGQGNKGAFTSFGGGTSSALKYSWFSFDFIYECGPSGGTMDFAWAQKTSNAAATTVHAGSFIDVQRIV